METSPLLQWAETMKNKADKYLHEAEQSLTEARIRCDKDDNWLKKLEYLKNEPPSPERVQELKRIRREIIKERYG